MLSVPHMLGMDDIKTFGDSTARVRSEHRAGDDGGGLGVTT